MSMPMFVNRPDLHLTKALSTLATIVADFGDYSRRFRRLKSPKSATIVAEIVAEIDYSCKCGLG